MPASERTWYRLICYTFCTCLWVFSFQVVLAVVFVLNLLVAFCTGNFHNVLTRVVRTAWQVELWIHSIYITDTKLPLPRADAIKRGTIWWTLLYFFVWKQIQTAYFASIGASIITNSSADQSAPSVPTSTVTSIPWPEIGLPFPLTTKPSTSSSSTGDESAAKVLIVVVVAFTINIFMVWISTWMTQSYYLWLIRDLELAESRQLLPRSEKKPFRLILRIGSPKNDSPDSPRSVSDDMESPPPSLPLGQHTSSVGSSHSTSSGYNRPISMPPMPPMPLMPPMGPVLPPLDPDQANKSIHPMLHFPSTLTERNGVLGFPVPPPPPVEGVAPSFWNSWLETPPTLAEKSTPKKDHHHKTHKHKGDPSMVDGKHHVHALRHLISLRKPGGLEEAKLHLEALQRELSRHTDVHDPRRRHLENLCRDFADELHTWESELDVAVTVQREKAKQDDATMDIARDRLQTLERLWETSDESARDDTLIEHLRNQLLALRAMVSSVPPTRQDRQIFDRHCDALSDNVARFVALQQEKAAWKAHEEEVERRKTAREGIQTQLNAMRQTLAVAVVLSADQKGSLEAICVDLERQLAELAEPLSPPPPTSTVATQPVLQSESIRVKEDRTFGESLVVFGGRPPASKETRRPVAEIVHTAPTDEFNEEDVLHAPKESRFLDVTLKAQSGWLSPSGYAQVPASYGLLSPVASAAASIATYGILSPLSSPKARDFDVAPTYRALDAPVKQDNVHFLAFAPPTVCHGMTFQFDIWAFLVNQRQEMLEQATSTNPSGRSLSREMLLQIRRGALIHVQLEVPSGFALKSEPTQALEWQGDVSSVAYDVQCTKKASTGQVLFKATIIVGSSVLILRSYLFVAANVDKDALSVQELTCELEALPKTFTEIPFNSLQLGGMVGRGNYGEAFRATYHGKEVVVKTIRGDALGDSGDQIVQEFRHEAAVLNMFGHHPHIVPFVGASTDISQPLSLITEYLPHGTIEAQYGKRLSYKEKGRILGDVAAGLLNMHEGGFIHRDIAARNCLVDQNLRAKVCDFGLCRRVNAYGGSHFDMSVGPLKYMAPESLQPPHAFSYKSDAFSFGVLMWETFIEAKPFASISAPEAAIRVLEGGRLDNTHPDIPKAYQELIASCFKEDPTLRPTMAELFDACRHLQAVD